MTIREAYLEGEFFYRVEDASYKGETRNLIGEGICVNTTTHIIDDPNGNQKIVFLFYFQNIKRLD